MISKLQKRWEEVKCQLEYRLKNGNRTEHKKQYMQGYIDALDNVLNDIGIIEDLFPIIEEQFNYGFDLLEAIEQNEFDKEEQE